MELVLGGISPVGILLTGLTIVFVRGIGRLARRSAWRRWERRVGLSRRVVVGMVPEVVLAGALLLLNRRLGLVTISSAGLWLSLVYDLSKLPLLAAYELGLLRLRWRPARVNKFVMCVEPGEDGTHANLWSTVLWSSPHAALGVWALPMRTAALVPHADVRSRLRGDLRKLDMVILQDYAPVAPPETEHWCALETPHLQTDRTPEADEPADEAATVAWLTRLIAGPDLSSGAPRLNRALLDVLAPDDWRTACDLCRNPPGVVTSTWRAFHAQESVRMRFVTLFNAVDLLQRVAGAYVFAALRRERELRRRLGDPDDFLRDGGWGDWNWSLSRALDKPGPESLAAFRQALAAPRGDFADCLAFLEPFWEVVGRAAPEPRASSTLELWRILGGLRNVLLGHGTIGSRVASAPFVYVQGLYRCALGSLREVARIETGVGAYREVEKEGERQLECITADQGWWARRAPDGSHVTLGFIGERSVQLDPYLRFHQGRLLVLDRVRNDAATYFDFGARYAIEPSYATLPVPMEEFLGPA
jgi:hypothetical protein